MAQYCWKCEDCEEVTEVIRAMKDYEIPPEACSKCKGQKLNRVIPEWKPHQTQLVLGKGGWHTEEYTRLGKPIR